MIVGGGSNAWTPNIVKDIMLTDQISNSQFVLYDLNVAAADLNKTYLEKLNGIIGTKAEFIATGNQAEAFTKADYFIITISTGGLNAMAEDLAIPEEYGIYHTVGDTSGPGGWARAIRNFEVFRGLGEAINQYAPGAMVLNYTNPMTVMTAELCQLCDGPVVGLCHGLFENLAFLKDYYKAESEEEFSVQYAGLNHFFWISKIKYKGKDILADLRKKIVKQSMTDLLKEAHKDEMGFSSKRELATELFRITGIMPYLGDRHTCEFLPSYITSKKNMRQYKLVRTSIEERRKMFAERGTKIEKSIKSNDPKDFNTVRSRETAADIIHAHSTGKPFIDVGNVPNIGQIANLPLGSVVETAVRVDQNGFTPLAYGELPEVPRAMLEPYCQVFDMTLEACFQQDRDLALQALRLDPVCSHLNGAQVIEMGEKLLKAHKKFISL